jgi:hypothetical protein
MITSCESTSILVATIKKIAPFRDHNHEVEVTFAVSEHMDALYDEFRRREIAMAQNATGLLAGDEDDQ